MVKRVLASILLLFIFTNGVVWANSTDEGNSLGPQSTQAAGAKKVLMVLVRFPDAKSSTPVEVIKRRVAIGLNAYVVEQSYGLASVKADFLSDVVLPDSLSRYKISPYNFQVDKQRIHKLISDTMTAIEMTVDFSAYDHMLIIPAVQTLPGKGYGMICYCANPGMLSGVIRKNVPHLVTVKSAGGKEFSGGIFVGTENANLGMFAHDYFHILGGMHKNKRLVPCLYDYERQSDSLAGLPSFDYHAVYMGPWDIMSQHFVRRGEPPQGVSSFTKIRLNWIKAHQVRIVKPGETSYALLAPLSKGGDLLAVKIPLADGTYYLVENRQPIGFDRVLPDSGIIVLKVNPEAEEGSGTVEVKSAGGMGNFAQAAYRLETDGRNVFIDRSVSGILQRNNIAIIPLWKEKDHLGVLITTPDQSAGAIRAGRAIQALMEQNARHPDKERETVIMKGIAAFKDADFERSYAIALGQ